MYQEHPAFDPPPADAVLWRYLDFIKLVSLLDRSALFFARADTFDDPFEGSISKMNEVLQPLLYPPKVVAMIKSAMPRLRQEKRRFTLVSCWHWSDHESAAMWKLYAAQAGIVVKTDFQSLKDCIVDDQVIYIGKVNYIDYMKDFIPERNSFSPFLYKRLSFQHEREVRAIGSDEFPRKDRGGTPGGGKYVSIDISKLIHEIIVSPYEPAWLLPLIQSVSKRYGLDVSISQSTLADPPTWG